MFYLKGQKHNLSGDVCFKLSNTEVSPPFFNQSLTAENQDCESREATLWIMEWGYKKAVWKHSCDWISGENRSGFICCNCKLTPTSNFPGVHFPLEGNKTMCSARVSPMVMSAHIFISFTGQRGANPSSAWTECLRSESSRTGGNSLSRRWVKEFQVCGLAAQQ